MAENSTIEWTKHTFNPWSGCTKVSAGCANCYAEANYSVKVRGVKWGPQGNRIVKAESGWKEPVKWNKDAACDCFQRPDLSERHLPSCPQSNRPRVFCASLADVFEDWQGPMLASCGTILGPDFRAAHGKGRLVMDDVRARLFHLIDATPNLDWLLLTKRPERFQKFLPWSHDVGGKGSPTSSSPAIPWPNVWLGVSVEDQANANERIPWLLQTPAAVRFVSYEPALGPVDFTKINCYRHDGNIDSLNGIVTHDLMYPQGRPGKKLDWIIVGGESGPNARPFDLQWARGAVEQCKAAGTACFVKQLGARSYDSELFDDVAADSISAVDASMCQLKLADKKGGDMREWPADLQVREMPR